MSYGEKIQAAMTAQKLSIQKLAKRSGFTESGVRNTLHMAEPPGRFYNQTLEMLAILGLDRNGDPLVVQGNGHVPAPVFEPVVQERLPLAIKPKERRAQRPAFAVCDFETGKIVGHLFFQVRT